VNYRSHVISDTYQSQKATFISNVNTYMNIFWPMNLVCYRQFVFVNCLWLLYRQTSCNKCPSAPH